MASLRLTVLAALAAVILPAFFFVPALVVGHTRANQAGATIKVLIEGGGHGSGAHIGRGYILTAAHVIPAKVKTVSIKTDHGETLNASVLWSNTEYDVALLRVDTNRLKSIQLSCRTPHVGEHVTAVGNPGELEFVTSFGQVSGSPRAMGDAWATVYVVDITIGPGVSGGPVLDAKGDIVGIAVGIMLVPVSMFSVIAPNYSFVVPSRIACNLMGRT